MEAGAEAERKGDLLDALLAYAGAAIEGSEEGEAAHLRVRKKTETLERELLFSNPLGELRHNWAFFESACCEGMRGLILEKKVFISGGCGGCSAELVPDPDCEDDEEDDDLSGFCPFCGAS
ncbi:MAG: hypothetical protein LBS92_01930 [Candidatus Methanoplasma sp.]|jgi:hypothetical protein|nr:hypothetical protein [Candidatus Methanoplasma sp.]